MKTKHHGFLTTDPKNLGTSLKISAHLNLPTLSKDSRLQTYLKVLNLNQNYRIIENQNVDEVDTIEEVAQKDSILEISVLGTLGVTEVS